MAELWAGPEQFGDWVRPYLPVMERVAAAFVAREVVDDVVQESLLRAWKRCETYDPARGSARSWLVAITAREARRHRSRFRRLVVPYQPPDLSVVDDSAGDSELRAHVAALSPRQREVTVWFYYVDLPVDVIADILGITVGTVKSTLSDARAALARLLGEERT